MLKPISKIRFNVPTVITITGQTCSGKSYLAETLISFYGCTRLTSTTDRAQRAGEVEGHDYYFISTEESKRLEQKNAFTELVTYNGTRYGVTKAEMEKKVKTDNPPPIVIVEPEGLRQYQEYCEKNKIGIFSILVETPEEIRLSRFAKRTTSDIMSAFNFLIKIGDPTQHNFKLATERHIQINNSRLISMIREESKWQVQGIHLTVYHEDFNGSLDQIALEVQARNERT